MEYFIKRFNIYGCVCYIVCIVGQKGIIYCPVYSGGPKRDNNDYINNQDEKTIKKFNFYNLSNFSHQLTYHTSKEIEGVDIFWYQYIFLNNAFTIFPKFSLVSNDGFDGSGTHCGISDKYDYKLKNLPIKNFSNSTIVDSLNNIFTYYFYLKMKIKDYITYHSKKIFTIFQSN